MAKGWRCILSISPLNRIGSGLVLCHGNNHQCAQSMQCTHTWCCKNEIFSRSPMEREWISAGSPQQRKMANTRQSSCISYVGGWGRGNVLPGKLDKDLLRYPVAITADLNEQIRLTSPRARHTYYGGMIFYKLFFCHFPPAHPSTSGLQLLFGRPQNSISNIQCA